MLHSVLPMTPGEVIASATRGNKIAAMFDHNRQPEFRYPDAIRSAIKSHGNRDAAEIALELSNLPVNAETRKEAEKYVYGLARSIAPVIYKPQ